MSATKMKTIRLYGVLGAKFGRVHQFSLETNSTAEAIRALCSQCHGLEAFLTQAKDNNLTFAVFIGKRNIGKDGLRYPTGDEDIRIAPVTIGSKKGGLVETIIGIVLVIVGEVLTAYGYGVIGQPIAKIGISMIIGGVVQMLSPHPKGISSKDNAGSTPNYNFNGPLNTEAQGHPAPVLYGELIVGSAVISASISIEDHSIAYSGGSTAVGYAGGGGDMLRPRVEVR